MRISVVVNTYNREPSLRQTLAGLRRQTHEDFEVIVVNGPSTDATADLLASTQDVRALSCPATNLSRSRNIGVAAASGEIVAFIDDDAIPEATWLSGLDAAYDDSRVAGAGGLVFDHTGVEIQYGSYSVCDRVGQTRFDVHRPLDRFVVPGADPFLYLQGTNMSFRRSALADIGGFDDDIEYMYDEVEVCLRLIDSGQRLVIVDGAAVHHRYLPSHTRNDLRITTRQFLPMRNRAYFALQYGRATRTTVSIISGLRDNGEEIKRHAGDSHARGDLSDAELRGIGEGVDSGLEVGIERGLDGTRVITQLPPPQPDAFMPYRTMRPPEGRLTVCLLSQEYPPRGFGGVGRYTADLAMALADRGHEVHVVTRSPDSARIDVDDGVWMHRVADRDPAIPDLAGHPMEHNLALIAGNHREVAALHARVPVDLVLSPLWLCEGAVCELDDRFVTVVTLVTSHKTISGILSAWAQDPQIRGMIALERATLERARHVHGISCAITETVRKEHGVPLEGAVIIPLGMRDRRGEVAAPPQDSGGLELLFVGRLERRKGADILLAAVPTLLEAYPRLRVTIAGSDTANTDMGTTYRQWFLAANAARPEVVERVTFTGELSDTDLDALYGRCDVFCAPSRYESFGLVLLEAMMFGKPVVACRTGGMPEIVEDGGNGLLALPGDVESLRVALCALLGDGEMRERFGRRSRELFEERFTAARMVEGIVTAFAPAVLAARIARADEAREVEARFGEVVAEVTGLEGHAAARAAAALLAVPDEATHVLLSLRRIWTRPPDAFVIAAHRLLTGEAPTPARRAEDAARIAAGTERDDLVRAIAGSSLGRRHLGNMPEWVDRLDEVVDEVRLMRLQALWPAPAETFLAAVHDLVLGRPPTRWEWLAGICALAGGRSRLDLLRSATTRAGGLGPGWLRVLEARAGAAAADPRATGLRIALNAPAVEFVDALYRLILQREADLQGRREMLGRLAHRVPRGTLVHDVAMSEEVAARRLDTAFLLGVDGAAPSARRWKTYVGQALRVAEPRLRRGLRRVRGRRRGESG